MRAVIQRVKWAKVVVGEVEIASIKNGLLVLWGVAQGDELDDLQYLVKKIVGLRIFSDSEGKMNLNIEQFKGSLLLVSQFTLLANTKKGNRPAFTEAAEPKLAEQLYNQAIAAFREYGLEVQTGEFAADMQLSLQNDGPVTIVIDSKNR